MESQSPGLKDGLGCQVIRRQVPNFEFLETINAKKNLKGKFKVEIIRANGDIELLDFNNDITNEGKNLILDIMFHDQTQIASSSWYIALISNAGYTALAAADTMASHGGWTEFTGYSQGTRVAWGPGAPSSQAITNGTPATFDITSSGTLKGVFVTSGSAKSGTSGKLWATALFSADVPVNNGDQIKITYTVSS